MRWKLILGIICGLVAFALLEAAAEAEPSIEGVEIKAADRVTIGDRFHYVVTIEADSGTKIGLAPGTLPPEFEQIGQPKSSSSSIGSGRSRISLDIEVAAFSPGELTIPPLSLRYEEPSGTTGTIETPPARILISSVLPTDGSDVRLRDLKPQLEIGKASAIETYLAAVAAVLLALVIVLALIVRSMRKKPAPAPIAVVTEAMGPEDRARAILERAGLDFQNDRDFVTYYGTIAVTMRNYLTERYGFHAFALTTVELRNEMGRRGIDRWQARLIDGLLTQCDAAVYARYMPAIERADHDLTAAFEIVEMSRPQPEPAAESAEPVGVR
ncbi:MAG: BatD family protein [Dehalococcoidia bacterium]